MPGDEDLIKRLPESEAVNGKRQIESSQARRVRIRLRRDEPPRVKRVTPAVAAAALLLSAALGVAIGVWGGGVIRRIWRERKERVRISEVLRAASSAPPPAATAQPSITPDEGR